MNIGKLTFTYCHLNVSPYKWPPAYVNYSSAWAFGFIVRCELTLLNQGQGHYYRSFGNENLTLSFMPYRVSSQVWSKWWVCFSSVRNVGAGASPPSLSRSLWPGFHWTALPSADWMIRVTLKCCMCAYTTTHRRFSLLIAWNDDVELLHCRQTEWCRVTCDSHTMQVICNTAPQRWLSG